VHGHFQFHARHFPINEVLAVLALVFVETKITMQAATTNNNKLADTP